MYFTVTQRRKHTDFIVQSILILLQGGCVMNMRFAKPHGRFDILIALTASKE